MNVTQQGRFRLNRNLTSLVVLCMLLLAPAASFCADVFKPVYVSEIEFEGNRVFSDSKLKKVMKTRERSILRPFRENAFRKDFLQTDIESIIGLYSRHGYLKTKVDSQSVERIKKGRAVSILLWISEGPRTMVAGVRIEGASALREQKLTKGLRLKKGVPFDPTALETDKLKILERYAEAGYIYATVLDNTVFEGNLASVFYIVREGIQVRTGNIVVEGNKATAERLVRREVTLKRGDVLRRSELIKTQQYIYDSELYSDVQISTVNVDTMPPVADLLILVKERKLGWVGGGIGYGSSDQLKVFSDWGHRNLFGSGKRLFTSASFAFGRRLFEQGEAVLDASRFDVGIVEPWLFHTRTAGQAVLYREYKREVSFSQEFTGFTFTVKRNISSVTKAFLSYDNRWVHTTDPTAIRREYVTRSLYLSGVRDSRDDVFDPGTGSLEEASWKVSGGVLGGNYNFHRVSAAASRYSPVRGKILAVRVKAGFAEPFGARQGASPLDRIPFEERFRTGGSTSIRGYVEDDELGPRDSAGDVVGGRVLLLTNVEVRFPLFWRLSGALFLDGGNVWRNPSDIKLTNFDPGRTSTEDSDYRYSFGGGIRVRTPVGPIRVDYGRKLRLSSRDGDDRGQFHISLGQAF
ncbi:MAG: outer membrane protein assembly factor BamA [Candidatus Eisenbacteria bacterium]|nr:outer membrane protein assembly factor BamA [Candidatus Eisenbacteria bacterium]